MADPVVEPVVDPAVAPPVEAPPATPEAAPTLPVDAPPAAPEPPTAYEFKSPDDVALATEGPVVDKLKALALELKLPQDKAQALFELGADMHRAQQSETAALIDSWTAASQTDAEFGGAKLNENLAFTAKVFDKFGTPELKSFLDETKLGNHPELIRWAYRVGKAMSQDTFVTAQTHSQGDARSTAQVLYPNQN